MSANANARKRARQKRRMPRRPEGDYALAWDDGELLGRERARRLLRPGVSDRLAVLSRRAWTSSRPAA